MKRLLLAMLVALWVIVPAAPHIEKTITEKETAATVQDPQTLEEYLKNSLGFFCF